MNNLKIRIKMIESGLKQYEVARLLGVSESVFSRKLRDELPEAEQNKIVEIIEKEMNERGTAKCNDCQGINPST